MRTVKTLFSKLMPVLFAEQLLMNTSVYYYYYYYYYFLWLCSPARAMASCISAVQRGLWPPVSLQSSAGYGLLVSRGFLITHNDAPQSVGLLWTSDQPVAETCT
jgi:hypothetical protein